MNQCLRCQDYHDDMIRQRLRYQLLLNHETRVTRELQLAHAALRRKTHQLRRLKARLSSSSVASHDDVVDVDGC